MDAWEMELRYGKLKPTIVYCFRCKHQNPDKLTCKAFPEGIPWEIIHGKVKHEQPIPGDNGIQFEQK